MKKNKILLISHDDSITGAPKLLLHLADLLYENNYDVTFVIKNTTGSNLLYIKKNNFKIFELRNITYNKFKRFIYFFLRNAKIHHFKWLLKNTNVVINNTIANSDLLKYYDQYAKGKLISYIHELDSAIDMLLPNDVQKGDLISVTSHFLVPSEYNKHRLSIKLNININNISILNYYIPNMQKLISNIPLTKKNDEFWVGMCGTLVLRKGVDIFIKIAEYIRNKFSLAHIKFLWLGFDGPEAQFILEDIRKLHLQHLIVVLPKTLHPELFFLEIDVFALTSREDPYPLVVLEAANASKPSICFDQSGGIIDFISNDCGYCVPYLNVEAFCEKIVYLYKNPDVGKHLGENAKLKLQKLHQNDKLILHQIEEVLQK